MNIYSNQGDKVVFTANGGRDYEKDRAKAILTLHSVYTVLGVEVGDFYSNVTLKEHPETTFNTCLFSDFCKEMHDIIHQKVAPPPISGLDFFVGVTILENAMRQRTRSLDDSMIYAKGIIDSIDNKAKRNE